MSLKPVLHKSIERPDFIDSFFASTEHINTPRIFRRWAGIAAVAAALERKVWVRTSGSNLYPNVYVFAVAGPAVGKSEVTSRVRSLIKGLEDHHLASSSVTKASLMDELNNASRRWVTHNPHNPVESFNSLSIVTNEVGVLLPAYENEFMNTLTDLWDCKDYSESRRHKTSKNKDDVIDLPRVQLNLFAAATPVYLNSFLPEGAWDMGFMSRVIMVYSGERKIVSLFAEEVDTTEQEKDCQGILQAIGNAYGRLEFTEEAAHLIDSWHTGGQEPVPDHPKLMAYTNRRTVHLLKLMMISSMSRSNELLIETQDFQRAFDWLVESESTIPDIFRAMSKGGQGVVMEEAWHYVYRMYNVEGQKPVMKHRLIQFLQQKVPVHAIEPTIDMMVKGKMIEKSILAGGAAYVPKTNPRAY